LILFSLIPLRKTKSIKTIYYLVVGIRIGNEVGLTTLDDLGETPLRLCCYLSDIDSRKFFVYSDYFDHTASSLGLDLDVIQNGLDEDVVPITLNKCGLAL
jgi:hypothetical protein